LEDRQKTMNIGKFTGCVMIVVGSAIGSGMLALPIQISGAGFVLSSITILLAWVLLTITGLLVIEVNLAFPIKSCSFSSMAAKTLGMPGKIVTWVSYLLLLCSIVAAYVAGESSLIINSLKLALHVEIPSWVASILFTVVLGGAVFWSTEAVDHFNRSLISIKGLLLITTLVLALPHIDIVNLIANQDMGRAKYLFVATPVFLHLFNFHFVIPSIRIYIGDRPRELKWIVILGTTVSLIIYLLWACVSLGIVPLTGDNSFVTLAQLDHPADSPDFIKLITAIIQNKWVTASINGFFNIAMTTSFLGVSLGLFDFLADGFRRKNTRLGRLQTAGLTFIPPLIFALFYPHGFIMALNYAASFIAILCLILPALMVCRLRKSLELKSPYRVAVGGRVLFTAIIALGVILFVLPILTNLHLLPSII
jgi:tyrosine-specific transport protein